MFIIKYLREGKSCISYISVLIVFEGERGILPVFALTYIKIRRYKGFIPFFVKEGRIIAEKEFENVGKKIIK